MSPWSSEQGELIKSISVGSNGRRCQIANSSGSRRGGQHQRSYITRPVSHPNTDVESLSYPDRGKRANIAREVRYVLMRETSPSGTRTSGFEQQGNRANSGSGVSHWVNYCVPFGIRRLRRGSDGWIEDAVLDRPALSRYLPFSSRGAFGGSELCPGGK